MTQDVVAALFERAARRLARLDEVLDEIEAFLDDQADADQEPGDSGPTPNQAMRLLLELREARRK